MSSPSRVGLFGKLTPSFCLWSVRGSKRLVQRDATRSRCALVHYVIPHIPCTYQPWQHFTGVL
ncbi:hypothetical protein BDV34DRAFT_195907 [Aspergillus parasiticus]|uniref:Uncharacterized protein n=1 Tax=Aspergillus parasiticus TaxID=5067 RepID=A0A5N6DJ94_ASPPA|nr:hypothetical protein BDV34DRAFT_195907 [Aspergillus parasiticus]